MAYIHTYPRVFWTCEGQGAEALDESLWLARTFAVGQIYYALFDPSFGSHETAYKLFYNSSSTNGTRMSVVRTSSSGERFVSLGSWLWAGCAASRLEREKPSLTIIRNLRREEYLHLGLGDKWSTLYRATAQQENSDWYYNQPAFPTTMYFNGLRVVADTLDNQGRLTFDEEAGVSAESSPFVTHFTVQFWITRFKVSNATANITCAMTYPENRTFLRETLSGDKTVVWRPGECFLSIEATKAEGQLAVEVLRNGTRIAYGASSVSLHEVEFGESDIFEIRAVSAKQFYIPLFSDIHVQNRYPIFANINNPNFKPLFRGFKPPPQFLSYSFKSRAHLWTRISDSYSNTANALPDAYFPGRDSHYDGSSGDSGQNIQVNLSLLYAHPSTIENTDGTKSITLYFFCALCNWGCTSDYESGAVDFKVLQKTFSVANIPRATSNDPGPGNEPFAFSFTITIRKNGSRYLATAVSITDKDGNTY